MLDMARRVPTSGRHLCELRRGVADKDDRVDRGHDRHRRSCARPDARRQKLGLRSRATGRRPKKEWVISDQLPVELAVTREELDALEITILGSANLDTERPTR